MGPALQNAQAKPQDCEVQVVMQLALRALEAHLFSQKEHLFVFGWLVWDHV